jgi:hypothetical protein
VLSSEDLIESGHALRAAGDGIWSVLAADADRAVHDDRLAAWYDRVVGNRLYNRLVWSTSPRAYAEFAATAVASASGPLLDVGCGTAVFTADSYGDARRPIVFGGPFGGNAPSGRGTCRHRFGDVHTGRPGGTYR